MASTARKVVQGFTVTIAGLFAAAALALVVARAALPANACVVTQQQIAGLVLETMTYADVTNALGCDGIAQATTDYGSGLVIKSYAWRGKAWPYGRFDGKFINGRLHQIDTAWLNIQVTR